MANKNKKSDEQIIEEDYHARINASIEKKWGKNILIDASAILEDNRNCIIPVSPAVDIALGGGVLSGTSSIFAGKPKSGKTTTCGTLAVSAQKQGRKVYWIAVEARYRKRDLTGIKGLNHDPRYLQIIHSRPDRILSGTDFLEIAYELLRDHPRCVVVIDSVSNLASKEELSEEIEKQHYAGMSKVLKKFSKVVSNILPVNDTTLLYINHLYASMSCPGNVISGGNGIKYSSDAIMKIKKTVPIVDSLKREVGQQIYWDVENSPVGPPNSSPPFSVLRYGVGLCRETELIFLGKDANIIEGDSWLTFPSGKKVQGVERGYQYLLENPQEADEIDRRLREMFIPDAGEKRYERPTYDDSEPEKAVSIDELKNDLKEAIEELRDTLESKKDLTSEIEEQT